MIAVTGAAGKTGRAVTAALSRRGVPVRALVHREEQAHDGVRGAAETIAVDLGAAGSAAPADPEDSADDRGASGQADTPAPTSPAAPADTAGTTAPDDAALRETLAGVDAIYLIAPNMYPDEPGMMARLIAVAQELGIRRVVYHSVIHPYVPAMPHHVAKAEVEAAIQESGLDWTILQPASYFENALGAWDSVRTDGIWPLPYSAAAAFTPVALDDVAEVAAEALTSPRHRFATYELAGPEVLTTTDMAEIAAEVLGHPVSVQVDRDPDAAAARPPTLQAMFDYYDAYGICGNDTVLSALLDRPPMTWRAWVGAHTGAWDRAGVIAHAGAHEA